MNEKIKLSVIIPVYNVEMYLNQCLNSIISKKCKDIEIILVDDGSTDKSGTICDNYSEKYSNIIVIHKKNGGSSTARNEGIKKASGEYLMFIDSDDFLYNNFNLNEFIKKLEGDIIQYKYIYFYNNTETYRFFDDVIINNEKEFYKKINTLIEQGNLSISSCNKIVKRSLIIENRLFFTENIIAEDIDWSLKLYLFATSLKIVNEDIYVYRQQRVGSITNTKNEKRITSLIYIIDYWCKYNFENNSIKEIYYNYLAYWYLILITLTDKKNYIKYKDEIEKYKFLLEYDKNKKVSMAVKINKIFGFKFMIRTLKVYNYFREKGMFKL